MNSDTEEIKSRLNIVEVVGEYLRLEKAGANWRANCPFHNEKTPSFMVNEERQIWHCFGCQKGGDVFSFVMEMEGLEFREALKNLAEKAGVPLKGFDPEKNKAKDRTLEILELSAKWYEYQLSNGPGKIKIMKYLRDRGLRDETIKEFRLGYAPKGWRNMLEFLTKRGYKLEEIEKTGLLVKNSKSQITNDKQIQNSSFYDRFRDRIMFPIADYSGKVVGYSARLAPGQDESQAKYVNTPETEVYHKSRILYGIDKAKSEIKKESYSLLVEGNMDVIASFQAGIKNVVAASGTALTEEQIKILKRYAPKIKMFFDMDSAGEAATQKSVKAGLSAGMEIEVVEIPQGKDAADLAKDDPEKLRKSVEKALPFMEYYFQKTLKKFDKNEARGKKEISRTLFEYIDRIENEVEKNHWIKKLSEEISVDAAALTSELKKASLITRAVGAKENISSNEFNHRQEKEKLLEDELLGLALVFPEIWKLLAERKEEIHGLIEDSLLNFILEKGEAMDFDFGKISRFLENRKDLEKTENLYAAKKYRQGLNGEPEEIFLSKPEVELEKILREIKKEKKKKDLERIKKDLREAEKRQDREAAALIKKELNEILEELSKLMKSE